MKPTLLRVVQIAATACIGAVAGIVLAYPGDDPVSTWHGKIPYQGHLTQSGDSVDGVVDLEFALYTSAASATPLWTETLADVTVSAGTFSVVLGENSGNPIPANAFSRAILYLEVSVDGTVLQNRQRVLAVPFASQAAAPLAPGIMAPYAGLSPPSGWLSCDGSGLSSSDYPALFAAIGTAYGDGTVCTTTGCDFNLPDLRGRFVRGVDGGAGNDPEAGLRQAAAPGGATGDEVGSLQDFATALPANEAFETTTDGVHTHCLNVTGADDNNHTGNINAAADSDRSSVQACRTTSFDGAHLHALTGGDVESRPVNLAVNWIIKI